MFYLFSKRGFSRLGSLIYFFLISRFIYCFNLVQLLVDLYFIPTKNNFRLFSPLFSPRYILNRSYNIIFYKYSRPFRYLYVDRGFRLKPIRPGRWCVNGRKIIKSNVLNNRRIVAEFVGLFKIPYSNARFYRKAFLPRREIAYI